MKTRLLFLCVMVTSLFSSEPIQVLLHRNLQDIGIKATEIFEKELNFTLSQKQTPVFILPTGSTPIPFYKEIVRAFFEEKLNLSQAVFFNMDEYVGLGPNNPDSYYQYMNQHLYQYLTPELTQEKLVYFGWTLLEKKQCRHAKTLQKLNQVIQTFAQDLIKISKSSENKLEAFETLFSKYHEKNKAFRLLASDYMDDKRLPSYSSLKSWIEKDQSLRPFYPQPAHIHRFNGNAADIDQEIETYKNSLQSYLKDEHSRVICFGGIGVSPAHIAFNDFISEPLFLNPDLSETEKNTYALESETRVVPLTLDTRKMNAHFFKNQLSNVPHHACSIGFKEILMCDHVIIMASGKHKKASLYNMFSDKPHYLVPASLLRGHVKKNLSLLIDQDSYGVGEAESLFSLHILDQETDQLSYIIPESKIKSFWEVPSQTNPFLLDHGQKIKHPSLHYASLPKKQKVLWVKEDRVIYSLWNRLKKNGNDIKVTSQQDLESLKNIILDYKPDLIILPFKQSFVQSVSKLSPFFKEYFPSKPILGLFYETQASYNNVHFPLTKAEVKKKVVALKEFHFTQSMRSNFDLITQEMSKKSSYLAPYTESFTFYSLENQKGRLESFPFPGHTLIEREEQNINFNRKRFSFNFHPDDVVLAVSPHPDDVEIGLGALIHYLGKHHINTIVLNATSGSRAIVKTSDLNKHPHLPKTFISELGKTSEKYLSDAALKTRIRTFESQSAIHYLNPNAVVKQLNLPFYDEKGFSHKDREIIDRCFEKHVQATKRLIVFMPHPKDSHPTHRMTHQIFKERLLFYLKKHPNCEVILAYYMTPWTGEWNLYDYSHKNGSKLSALIGAELLLGTGKEALKPEILGGTCAHRYRLFYFTKDRF